MKAILLKQPRAGLIAIGEITIETCTWETSYRGELLICASQKWDPNYADSDIRDELIDHRPHHFLTGHAVAIANLVDIRMMRKEDEEAALCKIFPEARAWILENIRPIEPFPVKGQLGLFEVEMEEVSEIILSNQPSHDRQ